MKLYTVLPGSWFMVFSSRKDCIRAEFRLRELKLLSSMLPKTAWTKEMKQAFPMLGNFMFDKRSLPQTTELAVYLGAVGFLSPETNFMLLRSGGIYHEIVGECAGWIRVAEMTLYFEEITHA